MTMVAPPSSSEPALDIEGTAHRGVRRPPRIFHEVNNTFCTKARDPTSLLRPKERMSPPATTSVAAVFVREESLIAQAKIQLLDGTVL